MIGEWHVGNKFERRHHCAEEEFAAVRFVQDQGVLSDPADAAPAVGHRHVVFCALGAVIFGLLRSTCVYYA